MADFKFGNFTENRQFAELKPRQSFPLGGTYALSIGLDGIILQIDSILFEENIRLCSIFRMLN